MKLFIVGFPGSGRSTVAKALASNISFQYIEYDSWLKSTFRPQNSNEHIQSYNEIYNEYLINRFKVNPQTCVDVILDTIKTNSNVYYIIDGVSSPRDFTLLFDFNKDIVIFLNRIDNEYEYKDSDAVGISVIRDYCFWLASAGFLNKQRWIEYNFKMAEDDNFIKTLGSKNSVYIAKSITKVISHIKTLLSI